MIGRSHEQDLIRRVLSSAAAGTSSVLVLRGPAGSGKTSLCAVARDAARAAEGWEVLALSGTEHESLLSLSAVADLAARLPRVRLPAAQQAAVDALSVPGESRSPDPFTLAAAIVQMLTQLARRRPVLLTVDDLHWVDPASIAVLGFVLRRLHSDAVAVVMATRTALPAPVAGPWESLELGGLDVREATDLIASVRGLGPVPAVAVELVARTAGNPLALRELGQVLSAEQLRGLQPLPDPLPLGEGGRASYGSRITALPEPTRTCLLVAAAAGSAADRLVPPALASLGLHTSDLDVAVDEHVITPGTWTFTHPLLRSAAYDAATSAERRDVHRRLAALLADDEPARYAVHLAAASGGVDESAAAAMQGAAQLAEIRHGPAASAPFWQQAADLTPPGTLRTDRLLAAARTQLMSGDRGGVSRSLLSLDESVLDPERLAAATVVRTGLLVWSPESAHELDDLEQRCEQIAAHSPLAACEALLNLVIVAQSVGQLPRAIRLATRAVELAGDDTTVQHVARAALSCAVTLGSGRERAESLVQIVDRPDVRDGMLTRLRFWAAAFSQGLCWLEELGRCEQILTALLRAGREQAALSFLPFPLTNSAEVAWWRGDWQLGRDRVAEAVELAELTGQAGLQGYSWVYVGLFAAARDSPAEMARALDAAARVSETAGTRPVQLYARWVRLHDAVARGDFPAAVEHGGAAHAMALSFGMATMAVVPYLPDYAEASLRTGSPEATGLLEELRERAEDSGSVWLGAAARRCEGLLRGPGWQKAFAGALAGLEQHGMPFESARTRAAYGEVLLLDGDRRTARAELTQACTELERIGAVVWRRRYAAVLRRAGGRVPPPSTGGSALSDQELRVCLAVAAGATNREAAAQLFLSEKTIEYHLRKAMTRLGVRNRTELAMRLHRSGDVAGRSDDGSGGG